MNTQPWNNPPIVETKQELFYYAEEQSINRENSIFVYAGKEIERKIVYNHPVAGMILSTLFDGYYDQFIWLATGKVKNCYIDGRTDLEKIKILKKT